MLLLGIVMLTLFAGLASATTTVTNNYPGWAASGVPPAVTLSPWVTIDRSTWLANPIVNFTVSGAPAGTYHYMVMLCQFYQDASFTMNLTEATLSGAVVYGNGSGNHSYQVALDPQDFLYDGISYFLQISVYDDPGSWGATNVSVLNMTSAGVSGTFIHFKDGDPPYLDLQGWRAIGQGHQFHTTGFYFDNDSSTWTTTGALQKQNIPLTILVTDNTTDHHLLANGVVNMYCEQNLSRDMAVSILGNAIKFHFASDGFFFTGIGKGIYAPRTSYYVFIGAPYTADTFVTCDDTFLTTLFSIDNYVLNDHVDTDISKTHKFTGVYTYFETFPKTGDAGGWSPGALPSSPIGVLILNFCAATPPNGLGMPWFGVVLGFLPAIILVCILYSASIKYHASLPNFLYMIAAAAGMTISLGISLMELWMYVFMLVLLSFTMILNYREEINSVAKLGGILTGKPLAMRNTGLVSAKKYNWKAHASPYKDQGVAKPLALPPYSGQRDYTRAEKIEMSRRRKEIMPEFERPERPWPKDIVNLEEQYPTTSYFFKNRNNQRKRSGK